QPKKPVWLQTASRTRLMSRPFSVLPAPSSTDVAMLLPCAPRHVLVRRQPLVSVLPSPPPPRPPPLPLRRRPARAGTKRPRPGRHVHGRRRCQRRVPHLRPLGGRRPPVRALEGQGEAAHLSVPPGTGAGVIRVVAAVGVLRLVGGREEGGPDLGFGEVREVVGAGHVALVAETGGRSEEPLRPVPASRGH
ncbi:unnamed protein product, partial [Musa acuminata subsp. malaccensis]